MSIIRENRLSSCKKGPSTHPSSHKRDVCKIRWECNWIKESHTQSYANITSYARYNLGVNCVWDCLSITRKRTPKRTTSPSNKHHFNSCFLFPTLAVVSTGNLKGSHQDNNNDSIKSWMKETYTSLFFVVVSGSFHFSDYSSDKDITSIMLRSVTLRKTCQENSFLKQTYSCTMIEATVSLFCSLTKDVSTKIFFLNIRQNMTTFAFVIWISSCVCYFFHSNLS
jgi:hypothetical protein